MANAKLLIIDDDSDYVDGIKSILDKADYEVDVAYNPKDGLEALKSGGYDLLLLDIMMDSMFDGYSFCNDIKTSKELDECKNIPIIMVSAVKNISGSRFAIGLEEQGLRGPDDYLDKPVKADELISRIEKLLGA